MNIIKAIIPSFSLAALALTAGCGAGAGTIHQTAGGITVDSGVAQKGPLARGSIVNIDELDAVKLAPNGKSYTYETKDDFGTFSPTSTFTSPYLEVTAQGYFFNESTGESGKDWVVLRGLSDLSVGADRAVNVNVLTNLTKDRIRALVTGKPVMTFTAARKQAQMELLNAFHIYNSADILTGSTTTPGNFMELDLQQARPADQLLAALSGLITALGKDGGGVGAFLNQVETDLADDGLLNNSPKFKVSVQQQFDAASLATNFSQIALNLNKFYGFSRYDKGALALWIDGSGGVDRIIDKYKYSADGVAFGTESQSPAYVAGSDDVGQCFWVSGGTLYKKGSAQKSAVKAVKGDLFTLGITPTDLAPQVSEFIKRGTPAANGACQAGALKAEVRIMKYTVKGAGLTAAATPLPATYLGANLPGVTDYAFTPIYVDLVKQGRQFGALTHPWGGVADAVAVGSDGWPLGDFGVFLMTVPGWEGTYKASFDGKADVSLNGSVNTTLTNKVYDPVKNLTTFDVVRGANGQHMVLCFANTGSGIKNLKVIRPGYDALDPPLFTREFLSNIARFKTLRFMDWLRTNNNPVSSWSARTTLNTRYASEAGVPWEHVIALANQTGKDIWINIPIKADDDYVLQLAKLLNSTLQPNIKVYVEYSNEIWNGGFSQSGSNHDLATSEVVANPKSTLVYDGTKDANLMAFRRIARRLKEISDIFRGVYGNAAMMRTVRPVFSGQVVQPYIAQVGLDFIDAVYGPPSNYFYATAGAAYFNLGSNQTTDGLSVDQILQAMTDSVTALPKDNNLEQNLALARWYNLPYFGYEGGSDTFGAGSIASKKAASLDPRMDTICRQYMDTWYAAGTEMMMWFTAGAGNWDTQYGTWELTSDIAVTDTPKTRCMDETLAGVIPALKGRNVVPGTFTSLAYVGNAAPYTDHSRDAVRYLHPGSYIDYLILAPKSGTYSLVLTAEATNPGNTITVSLNSKAVATEFELKAGGWGTGVENSPIMLSLNKGFNTIRIRTRTENLGFYLTTLTIRTSP